MDFLQMIHADSMREAAALLARRGYDNVQAASLAGALRMSVGSLYRHYGSKLGLALAVRDFTEKELSYQADVAFLLTHGKPGVDFAQAFFTFWWELAGWALTKPDLFHFTFLHWHAQDYGPHSLPAPAPRRAGALIPQQSYGGATRALVRQVLEQGEREGALAPGCVRLGEGWVWGALLELARAAWQGEQVGEAEEGPRWRRRPGDEASLASTSCGCSRRSTAARRRAKWEHCCARRGATRRCCTRCKASAVRKS